jgi:hypothetical protein
MAILRQLAVYSARRSGLFPRRSRNKYGSETLGRAVCYRARVHCVCALEPSSREEIDVLPLQTVKSLAGVVTVNGHPVPWASVVECSSDWKSAIRKTSTDAQGRFALATVEGRKIYYLQFSALRPDINPARMPVKISRVWGKKSLDIRLHLGVSTIAHAVVRSSLAIWR